MKNQFSKRLLELRLERKLTQKQLAEKLNISDRSISYWERGERECNLNNLVEIAAFFEVSTDFLLGISDY